MLESLLNVLHPINLMWIAIGSIVGAIIGALPGLTATMGVALFIPLTFSMEPATGLVLLAAVYSSASFGGNITAILIKTPGTPDSFFMVLDGYPMTKRGQGSRAIAVTTIGAFCGGVIGALTLLFCSSYVAKLAVILGPLEMFLITLIGICVIVSLTQKSMLKGFLSAALGLAAAFIGTDPFTSEQRFTFGRLELFDGDGGSMGERPVAWATEP